MIGKLKRDILPCAGYTTECCILRLRYAYAAMMSIILASVVRRYVLIFCLLLSAVAVNVHAQTYPNNTGAKAYPNNPFVLNGDHYVSEALIGGFFTTRLVNIVRDNNTYSTVQIGPITSTADGGYPNGFEYNALGFNPLDNYMYAVVARSPNNPFLTFLANDVIRIDGEGIATVIGRINLPSTLLVINGRLSTDITGGTFLEDGTFVVITRRQGQISR